MGFPWPAAHGRLHFRHAHSTVRATPYFRRTRLVSSQWSAGYARIYAQPGLTPA